MAHRVTECPVCAHTHFDIERLRCPQCNTALEGHFTVSRLAFLPDSDLAFVEVFLKARGNIKEVERELGISYPTVRSRLDKIVRSLGLSDSQPRQERVTILESLERQEISVDEAIQALREVE